MKLKDFVSGTKENKEEAKPVKEKLSDKDMKKRLAMIRKSVEKITKANADKARKDALKMMKDSGMFDEDAGDHKHPHKKKMKEGTWDIPDNKNELAMLADMLMKPFPATKPSDLDKFLDVFPVGDDSLYDAIDSQMYEKNPDGSVKRPIKKLKTFPKVFLNVIAGENLMKNK